MPLVQRGLLPPSLTRATGLSAFVLAFVFLFAVRAIGLLLGEELYALEYFAAFAGLATGTVLLPRGVGAAPGPSFWQVASGRAARTPSAEPCDDYAFAFGVVLGVLAGVAIAAYWAASEIYWLLQFGLMAGLIGALYWWAKAAKPRRAGPHRWVTRGDLKGHPTPPVNSYDVRTWTTAHTFVLHFREWWYYAAVAGLHFAAAITLGDWVTDDRELSVWLASAAVVGVVYVVRWMRTGGWVTVDPERREVAWRRPRDNAPTRTWRFDEFEAVELPRGAANAVRLDVGSHVLRVRVPTGAAPELVNSLRLVTAAAPPAGARHG